MTINKEEIKNKIIYRASYRGTKEMDILMTSFVRSIINKIDENYLETLNDFVTLIFTQVNLCRTSRNPEGTRTQDRNAW